MYVIHGASSPLGQFLASELSTDSDGPAIGISRNPLGQMANFKNYDLNEFLKKKITINNSGKVTLINVSAAVPAKYSHSDEFFRINCFEIPDTLKKICDTLLPHKIINISTSDVYNHKLQLAEESLTGTPSNSYGMSKLLFENLLNNFCDQRNIKCLNLRVPVLIVPGVKHNFISKWFETILQGDASLNYSNPSGLFNNVGDARHITSIARTFHGMETDLGYTSCNVCSSNTVKVSELISIVEEIISPQRVDFVETDAKKVSQPMSTTNINKICPKRYSIFSTLKWYFYEMKQNKINHALPKS